MPLATQIKMLRLLEDRKITRVGDNRPIDVNVRVIAATNKDLEAEIAAGRFRNDLYFRLKIVTIHLDPLTQRREDIIPLADFFRKQANKNNGKNVKGFSKDVRAWILSYSWPGNVRQLKNVVESLVVMDIDGLLDMDDLSPDLLDGAPPTAPTAVGENSDLVGKSLRDIERWAIEQTLRLVGGNREETAAILGISQRNLYRKLNEYNLS